MSRRDNGRSHSPGYIKGPPLRSEEKISSSRTPPLIIMQPQGDSPDNAPHYQCTCRASHPSEGVRLTTPTGDTYHPSHVRQRDVGSQYEAPQLLGMVTVGPAYWPENHPVPNGIVLVDPPPFSPGHPEQYGCLHGQWHSSQYPICTCTPSQLPESPDEPHPPGVGEDLDPAIGVGYAPNPPHWDAGPSSEDHMISPRCGTDPGGLIHLVEEVCPYSTWKTHFNPID